ASRPKSRLRSAVAVAMGRVSRRRMWDAVLGRSIPERGSPRPRLASHDRIVSMPARGGRVIRLERLRWATVLLGLLHVVEARFGTADVTESLFRKPRRGGIIEPGA